MYQGAFSETDEEIGWNDFQLRNYDPQIGRFVQQDPFQQFSSPYTGMANDPITVDPTGGIGIPCPGTSGLAIFLDNAVHAISSFALSNASLLTKISIGVDILKTGIFVAQTIQTSNMINGQIASIQVGEISEKSPREKFPDFWTIHSNYPRPYKHKPDRTPADPSVPVDDNIDATFRFPDQCAIRVSVALRKSGVDLKGVRNITNPGGQTYNKDGDVLGAKNLFLHIQRNLLKQEPIVFDGTTQNVKDLLKGKKGIIYFEKFLQSGSNIRGGAHIDLWNGFNLQSPYESQMFDAKNIRFLEIK